MSMFGPKIEIKSNLGEVSKAFQSVSKEIEGIVEKHIKEAIMEFEAEEIFLGGRHLSMKITSAPGSAPLTSAEFENIRKAITSGRDHIVVLPPGYDIEVIPMITQDVDQSEIELHQECMYCGGKKIERCTCGAEKWVWRIDEQ